MTEAVIDKPRGDTDRGRVLFARFRPLFDVCKKLLRVLPRGLSGDLLVLARPVPFNVGIAMRYIFLTRVASSCGSVVAVFEDVYVRCPANLDLGNNVSIHPMCYVDATGSIVIGSDVSIAHGVTIMSTEHDYSSSHDTIRDAPVRLTPVVIGNDVWIGAGAKILGGSTIGDHTVIGAGAVVTRDIPAGSIAVGVPAEVIKQVTKQA